MRINAVRLAYRHRRRQLRSPLACGEGNFPLPKAVRNAILAWKPAGIWRMSVETDQGPATDTLLETPQ